MIDLDQNISSEIGYQYRKLNSIDRWASARYNGVYLECRIRYFSVFNPMRPRQNGGHFADDILKCIFLNENAWIAIKISPKFVHEGSINNIPALVQIMCPIHNIPTLVQIMGPVNNTPALVQIMAWRRPSDKPLSEQMLTDAYLCHSASMSQQLFLLS